METVTRTKSFMCADVNSMMARRTLLVKNSKHGDVNSMMAGRTLLVKNSNHDKSGKSSMP